MRRAVRTGVARVDIALASARTSVEAFIHAATELCISVTAGLMVALIWHMITAGHFEAVVGMLMPGSLPEYLDTPWVTAAAIVGLVCFGACIAVSTVMMMLACIAHLAAAIVFVYCGVGLLVQERRS